MSNETLIHSFTKRRSRLALFARRLLGNDDEAEDVLQEAFCRLWPRAETLESDADVDRMAMTTVKNLSIDVLRERQIHATQPIEGLADSPPADDAPSAARQLDLVERIARRHLTPQQWRIFRSHDIEGLGYAEKENYYDLTLKIPADLEIGFTTAVGGPADLKTGFFKSGEIDLGLLRLNYLPAHGPWSFNADFGMSASALRLRGDRLFLHFLLMIVLVV